LLVENGEWQQWILESGNQMQRRLFEENWGFIFFFERQKRIKN
jgi:hypothetical protein